VRPRSGYNPVKRWRGRPSFSTRDPAAPFQILATLPVLRRSNVVYQAACYSSIACISNVAAAEDGRTPNEKPAARQRHPAGK